MIYLALRTNIKKKFNKYKLCLKRVESIRIFKIASNSQRSKFQFLQVAHTLRLIEVVMKIEIDKKDE